MTQSSKGEPTKPTVDGKTEGKSVAVFVRPVSSYDLDFANFSAEAWLNFVKDSRIDSGSFPQRYQETDFGLFVVPSAIPRVIDPLMFVAREARANYILGNFMSTIALVGYAAEVFADLLGGVQFPPVKRPQKKGNMEGQKPFVDTLLGEGILSKDEHEKFLRILKVRNDYLHHRPGADIARDAQELILLLPLLLQRLFGQSFTDGKINFQKELVEYLHREGHFTDA